MDNLSYQGPDPLDNYVDDLIDQIKELRRNIQENWPELGEKLNELSAICGKTGQLSIILEHRIRLPASTASYLMNISNRFKDIQLPPPRHVSWRQLAEVHHYITPLNLELVIEKCIALEREELIELVRSGFFDL